MGMEEQIMCVEQCTFQISSVSFLGPQNTDPQLGLKGPTLRPLLLRREEGKGGDRGAKMIYGPGRQKPSCCHWSNFKAFTLQALSAALHFL